jgi:hypothetical protein
MRRNFARMAAVVAVSLGLVTCSNSTAPRHANVDHARIIWLGNRPSSYSFEVAIRAQTGQSDYYQVQVANGQVVAAIDPADKAVANFTLTIDKIWDQVLAARAKDELHSALFDERGVPVESDMGPWELDGGVHYSVRNFAATR